MNPKNFRTISLIAVACLFAAILCAAQDEYGQGGSKGKSTSQTKVTGCLQKGDEPDEYSITDNGKTYGLRSSKIDLSKHLGHMVSVTGTLKPESAESEASEKNEKSEKHEAGKEAGDIQVTNLKMIKESCK
jgi:hypothetical protein